MQQREYNIAIVGATGAVGKAMREMLAQSSIAVGELRLMATERSKGMEYTFRDTTIAVEEITPSRLEGVDFVLFGAGGEVSKRWAPHAVSCGAVCVDNSSAYRMDSSVPLIVPEVNAHRLADHRGIIANPNCSTIQMLVALKPLHDRYRIQRLIVSTYQSVSGAGDKAIEETIAQTKAYLQGQSIDPTVLPVASLPNKHPIAFNVIPQIDAFGAHGYTLEEHKMINETHKIFEDDTIGIAATCIRVPVLNSHSESVYIQCAQDIVLEEVYALLRQAPGVVVVDAPDSQKYPMPIEATGHKAVFVGRVRPDLTDSRGLHLWIVSDNLLKGAAWNAVQIIETLIHPSTSALSTAQGENP